MVDINQISEGLAFEEYIRGQKKEVEQNLKNEGLLLSYRKVLSDPDGRRVIWDILSLCKVFHLSMTGNSWTYFNEGGRQIGLYIMSMINIGNSIEDVETGFRKLMPEQEKKDG